MMVVRSRAPVPGPKAHQPTRSTSRIWPHRGGWERHPMQRPIAAGGYRASGRRRGSSPTMRVVDGRAASNTTASANDHDHVADHDHDAR